MASTAAAPKKHVVQQCSGEEAASQALISDAEFSAGENVPTLRELEARMADDKALAEARLQQKSGFVVRLLRELGLMRQPATCQGFTRQAVPCKRPAIRQGFCRLHGTAVLPKKSKSFLQRLAQEL